MGITPNATDKKFVRGQHYKFDPPVETNCMTVAGGEWERKKFTEGWCIGFRSEKNVFVFQGKPLGENVEHYFHVEWGKGSAAENIPPPHLRRVK